ncbi:MAG TPA: methyltransferase domain-containing protein [Ktedonobacteraceae bacterium]
MADASRTRRERVSTYMVQGRSYREELRRLYLQDQMLALLLGGILAEQADPTRFQAVLDVACGTGRWLIEMAQAYPTITRLVGTDISRSAISYASKLARNQPGTERVEFYVMDALGQFDFPNETFDLANLRFAASFLRAWEWPQVLREFKRVLRPAGVIRLTEADWPEQSSSQALLILFNLLANAFREAGAYVCPRANGIGNQLADLLRQSGFQEIQAVFYQSEIHAETATGELFKENMQALFRTAAPFIRKWTRVPDDYESLYRQMLREMQRADFVVTAQTMTIYGSKR